MTDDTESKAWSLCSRIPKSSTYMCMATASLNSHTWSDGVIAHVDSQCLGSGPTLSAGIPLFIGLIVVMGHILRILQLELL